MMRNDEYLWLEDILSDDALAWVGQQNAKTSEVLETDCAFEGFRDRIFAKLTADDRVPYGSYANGFIYNFWQDASNPRGIWRRATLEDYIGDDTEWQTLLSIDALNESEGGNWVFKGANRLASDKSRALLSLSDGGKDAAVIREFDIEAKAFVSDGFELSEAKLSVAWLDENRLLVGSSKDPLGASDAGYAIVIRILERGMSLADATVVYQGQASDMAVFVGASLCDGERFVFITRRIGFFESQNYWLRDDGRLIELPVPLSVELAGVCGWQALLQVKEPWNRGSQRFEPGSVVSLDLDALRHSGDHRFSLVYTPDAHSSVMGVAAGRGCAFIVLIEDVKGRVLRATFSGGCWKTEQLPFPDNGTVGVQNVNGHSDVAMFSFTSFLEPGTLYLLDDDARPKPIKSAPERFDASGYTVSQHFADSSDDTRIPYFLIEPAGTRRDGTTPVLLFGYGGFERSFTPQYLPAMVQEWLATGGAYVVANIRGGGEYGPKWHRAVLREKRVLAFDDFIAVAEDLITSGVTSSTCLAIKGGSNGGLLMGAMLTRRPDLFSAIICRVPLLDMLRYHKLLAGASWMAEYGNPDDENDRAYLEKLSPYHNLRKAADYPRMFFATSTRDDRVHPGHARKMYARMQAMGYDNLYFENIEGGHGAAASPDQMARVAAMELVYLHRQLADQSAGD